MSGNDPSSWGERIDAICDEFEALVRSGNPPFLEPHLARVDGQARDALLRELLPLAVELLSKQGEDDPVAKLITVNPEIGVEIRSTLEAGVPTRGLSGATQTSAGEGLHVRCPHCHGQIEIVPDTALDSVSCPVCGSDFSLVSDDAPTTGARAVTEVAHFRLIERVGMGAFGSVWKAHDSKLDRTVAIKIPRKGQFDADQERAFLREAQNAAQVNHPNVVPVYEVGRDGETLYIVSEFVRGLTLSDWLTGQRPTAREAAELTAKIARALDHAHSRGVLHRDLKPGNIMLDGEGEPHLMDFGLAKRESSEITMTLNGQVLGTPAYMSPEQAEGDAEATDRRTDIYAIGVTLFQLLTGELPYRGNARMQMHQKTTEDAPSPRKLDQSIPRDLETITLKCLERSPAKRYDSAVAVAEELQRWLDGLPIEARPVTRVEKAIKWTRRNPLPAASLAAIVLSLAGVAGAAVWSAVRDRYQLAQVSAAEEKAQRAASEARQSARLAREAEDVAKAELDENQRLVDFQRAQDAILEEDLGEAFDRLSSADQLGSRFEYGDSFGRIVERSREYFVPIARFRSDTAPLFARLILPADPEALSRQEAWVVTVSREAIESRNWLTGEVIARKMTPDDSDSHRLSGPLLSVDRVAPGGRGERRVVVRTARGRVVVLSVPELNVVCCVPDDLVPFALASARDAPVLAAVHQDWDSSDVTVIDAETGQTVATKRFKREAGYDHRARRIALSPDGSCVAAKSMSTADGFTLWEWATDRVTKVAQPLQGFAFASNKALVGTNSVISEAGATDCSVVDTETGKVSKKSFYQGDSSRGGRTFGVANPQSIRAIRVTSDYLYTQLAGFNPQAIKSDSTFTIVPSSSGNKRFGVAATSLEPARHQQAGARGGRPLKSRDQPASGRTPRLLDFDETSMGLVGWSSGVLSTYAPRKVLTSVLAGAHQITDEHSEFQASLMLHYAYGRVPPKKQEKGPLAYFGKTLESRARDWVRASGRVWSQRQREEPFKSEFPSLFWAATARGRSMWTVSGSFIKSRGEGRGWLAEDRFSPGHGHEWPPKVQLIDSPFSEGEPCIVAAIAVDRAETRLWTLWAHAKDLNLKNSEAEHSYALRVVIYRIDQPNETDPEDPYNEQKLRTLQPETVYDLGSHLSGGQRLIRRFFVDPSGTRLLLATTQTAAIYDAADGKLLHRLPESHSFAATQDGRYVATGSWFEEQPVRVWDLQTGELRFESSRKAQQVRMAFGPRGEAIWVGWNDATVSIYDLNSGVERRLKTDLAPVRVLADGNRYIGFDRKSGTNGDLVVADQSDGRRIAVLRKDVHVLTDCHVSREGGFCATMHRHQVRVSHQFTRNEAVELLTGCDDLRRDHWMETIAYLRHSGRFPARSELSPDVPESDRGLEEAAAGWR